ncbi:hypothetical protein [Thermococcus gammatolerans]|uniref:Uncharacterized protein n=1 Tax=Thermococcus gammatolerans (strain DSM 15229 / JCM 11827 / EJ3) TaxID=593117 RepID=C5A341_THEGJ|nr:hypothetical protein [Thermococcus gammatolerans]ACS32653.1 Conserved hypothetical protein [Thermococcus gammatolerans EJ3]
MMTMIVEKALSLALLSVFLGLNVMVGVARFTVGMGSSVWRRVLRVEIPENEKKGYEILYTVIWIAIGLWAFWKLKDKTLLGAVLGIFTFRSGSNLSKTLIYTVHDQRIVREYSNEGRLLSIIGRASTLSLLIEALFVVTLGIAYKTLSITLKSGMSAGNFLLYLWGAGFLFGLLFGWFVGRNNRGILMSNAFPILVFFMARTGKKKTEEVVRKPLERFRR